MMLVNGLVLLAMFCVVRIGSAFTEPSSSTACVLDLPVALDPGASGSETAAANELALWAGSMISNGNAAAPLSIVTPAAAAGRPHLAVGVGAALAAGLPPTWLNATALGDEGFVASCSLIGSGGCVMAGAANASRGSLYSVYHALHQFGVRFFAPNASHVPPCPTVFPASLTGNMTSFVPKFEYRAINGWAAMHDPMFAQRLHLNDRAHLYQATATTGTAADALKSQRDWPDVPGSAAPAYAAGYFVHSIFNLLQAPPINGGPRQGAGPPTRLYETHRQWFSPSCASASTPCQVCWSNQSLVAALIEATKSVLRAQPTARIMSISQEDNMNQ